MSTENLFEEARLLREVVAAVINHLAAGGHVVRNDRFFKDLKRVHRATRDLQQQIQANPQYMAIEFWQNVACNLAFFAGMRSGQVESSWSVVLDSMLEGAPTFDATVGLLDGLAANEHAFGPAFGALRDQVKRAADELRNVGARETSLARSLASLLGIELRESSDGGRTWLPMRAVEGALEHATAEELLAEIKRRTTFNRVDLGVTPDRTVWSDL